MTIGFNVHDLRLDGGTQSRAALNEAHVDMLFGLIADGKQFDDPIVVFHDGEAYWLADGFHRVAAVKKASHMRIDGPVDVRQGTRRDAVLYSCGANQEHRGLPRSKADKRRAVETLLADEEWSKWSAVKIAEMCGVGHNLVSNMKLERSSPSSKEGEGVREIKYTTKHGTDAVMKLPPAKPATAKSHPRVTREAAQEEHVDDVPAVAVEREEEDMPKSRPDKQRPEEASPIQLGKLVAAMARAVDEALELMDKSSPLDIPYLRVKSVLQEASSKYSRYKKGDR